MGHADEDDIEMETTILPIQLKEFFTTVRKRAVAYQPVKQGDHTELDEEDVVTTAIREKFSGSSKQPDPLKLFPPNEKDSREKMLEHYSGMDAYTDLGLLEWIHNTIENITVGGTLPQNEHKKKGFTTS